MRYIVFDLEWNQCPSGKSDEVAELPFEIFEIGAVKLDDNMQRIGSFSCYIKPKVYKELHYIAKGLPSAESWAGNRQRCLPEMRQVLPAFRRETPPRRRASSVMVT